ncbi:MULTISPECIES: hypothetical protein [unclassified Aureimonas]|uniref:hypothetical protein n=1 Tax=unclassified Aureimonas TaxID=2615206 RepID=UPI0006F40304|nr:MULTISPECIES: hypothetical protein [unclassified Aureimonas]KQT57656.1 hypothetical protein ASG62_24875 [Aureimonas sp. Leaf427]KQT65818.1 hypothetical protein ASG54_22520 [Aureimonas sp. Leaf460]
MPIKPELRGFYPIDWRELSHSVRFRRAKGTCERCGRPHGRIVCVLADGRWFDEERGQWRDGRGKRVRTNIGVPAELPEGFGHRTTKVVIACAHLNHDVADNAAANLAALCQRCHMIHDRPHHLARRRITYLMRRAIGDLFAGPYR